MEGVEENILLTDDIEFNLFTCSVCKNSFTKVNIGGVLFCFIYLHGAPLFLKEFIRFGENNRF